jgi:hypothetical protein
MPSMAKICDTLTLGTTEENASTNSYAKINQLADSIATGTPQAVCCFKPDVSASKCMSQVDATLRPRH